MGEGGYPDLIGKKIGIKAKKNIGLKKVYFWGNPVIQAVEAKMLGPYYQKIIFLQNISSLKNQPFLSTTS